MTPLPTSRRATYSASGLTIAAVLLLPGAVAAAECNRAALASGAPPSVFINTITDVKAEGQLPAFCRVEGIVDREISFELRLPETWNGKFLFQGYGGLDGAPPALTHTLGLGSPGTPLGIQRGYAVVTTDTGHRGAVLPGATAPVYDANWALGNIERQVNWAHRSTHVVAEAAKDIIRAFYGRPPQFSYYQGCSGGGRQAAMAAQRYPRDFNGIVSAAPWLNVTAQTLGFTWISQTLAKSPVSSSKLGLIAKAVTKACDAQDGLEDGQVTSPQSCKFDPQSLVCSGEGGTDCLTKAEADSLDRIYAGPSTSDGRRLFPGLERGGEDLQWPDAIVNPSSGGPGTLLGFLPDQILRYFVFGPHYDLRSFNFDRDPAFVEALQFANVKPDLAAFRDAGGKLLMWHGWNDPRLSPSYSILYREDVVRALGGRPEVVDDFYRLFMAPGVGHCSGGNGPNTFDALAALEAWVERRVAPASIVATHRTAQGVAGRTRPLCPYPQVAVYSGQGSVDDAANFTCRTQDSK
jgi:feruloyl esterase